MILNILKFFLLPIGLLFCLMGCNSESDNPLEPNNISSVNAKTSFEQNLLPILTARCAYSGCHDVNGPHGLDFRTYQNFISGDDDSVSVFIPGNAQNSDIIEEIVSGRMPPDGPPLTAAEIQLFRDWINQQDPADFPNLRYEEDDHGDHDHDHDHDHD
ncbi:hypothetical protein C6501_08335 [Candidatus Poribacteria bacterium]|nr:MAG: hypothetical protein C6501_08335 [Candidatus Poribacteria bacterium]